MGQQFVSMSIPIISVLSFVALIALTVAAIHDGRHSDKKNEYIKRIYVYLVAFITLLLIGSSLIDLLNTSLRASVFTKADPSSIYSNPPPSLYLAPSIVEGKEATGTAFTCATGCDLSEQNKTDIAAWATSYKQWQDSSAPGVVRAQGLIAPISFLIVAGLVYLFHWRLTKGEKNEMHGQANLTRATYTWAMSFIWLIVVVFSAGFLLNTTLRALIPGAGTATKAQYDRSVPAVMTTDLSSVTACATACGLSSETVALAAQWKTDYQAWTDQQNDPARERHNNFSSEIAFLIVGIPFFFYHFRQSWRKKAA